MLYNPAFLHRLSIRLKGYDYAQAGLYFITICCNGKIYRFGEIVGEGFTSSPIMINKQFENAIQPNQVFPAIPQMKLNEFGIVAYNEWINLPQRFPNAALDVFQIMPNHIHGIILLNEIPTPQKSTPEKIIPTSISKIVGAYK